MVKKVVYPPKIRGRGPYDFTDSRDTDKQPSFLNKVKSFINFGKRALSGSSGDNSDSSSMGDLNERNGRNGNTRESSLSSRPFKYQPPDASFISNLTSRNTSRISSLEAKLSTSTNVDRVTDKSTLLKYLNSKGFSDLESEGIVAVAKQLKDADIDNGNTGETTLQKVDYLTHSNKFLQYLKAPSESKQERKNLTVLPSKPIDQNETNENVNLISERPNNDAVGNDTSIFMISANNTATQVMNSSIYSNTTMKRRRKRIYRYSEMGAPYKIGVPNNKSNRSLAVRGNSTFLDYNNNSFLGNESFVNNTVSTILPVDDNISKTNSMARNENKVSSTALALLETIDIPNKSNLSSEKTKDPLKIKNITYINPYSNSHLSKVSKHRKSTKKFRKDSENDLLTSIEESSHTNMVKVSPNKVADSQAVISQTEASYQTKKQDTSNILNGNSTKFDQQKNNKPFVQPKSSSDISDNKIIPVEKSINTVQIQNSRPPLVSQKPVEKEQEQKSKKFSFGTGFEVTEKKNVDVDSKFNSSPKTNGKKENLTPFVSDSTESVKAIPITSAASQSLKNQYSGNYIFEFNVKQRYNASDVIEREVNNYKSLYLF